MFQRAITSSWKWVDLSVQGVWIHTESNTVVRLRVRIKLVGVHVRKWKARNSSKAYCFVLYDQFSDQESLRDSEIVSVIVIKINKEETLEVGTIIFAEPV